MGQAYEGHEWETVPLPSEVRIQGDYGTHLVLIHEIEPISVGEVVRYKCGYQIVDESLDPPLKTQKSWVIFEVESMAKMMRGGVTEASARLRWADRFVAGLLGALRRAIREYEMYRGKILAGVR